MKIMDYIKSGKTYIIAEMSANHGGSLEHALKVVHAAKEAGADCLKIQTYTADTISLDCDNEYFRLTSGLWKGTTRYKLYQQAYTPWEWHEPIKEECEKVGLDFFSSPFDFTAVDYLANMNVEAYKIASPELVDLPLIRYAAKQNKVMVMSCGMASVDEIQAAIDAVKSQGNEKIILLKCTTEYPANPADMNLLTIQDMKNRFGVPVGLSDHTEGSIADVIGVSLGACVIEKHFCISREEEGADISFSMDKKMFTEMVNAVRDAEVLLGSATYELSEMEKRSRTGRRSLFVVKDIKQGEIITPDNVKSIRPAAGLSPDEITAVIGKRVNQDILLGTPLSWEHIDKGV